MKKGGSQTVYRGMRPRACSTTRSVREEFEVAGIYDTQKSQMP